MTYRYLSELSAEERERAAAYVRVLGPEALAAVEAHPHPLALNRRGEVWCPECGMNAARLKVASVKRVAANALSPVPASSPAPARRARSRGVKLVG